MENSHVVFSGVRDERNYDDFQLSVVEAISQTHFSPGKDTNMCQVIPSFPCTLYIYTCLPEAQRQITRQMVIAFATGYQTP